MKLQFNPFMVDMAFAMDHETNREAIESAASDSETPGAGSVLVSSEPIARHRKIRSATNVERVSGDGFAGAQQEHC